MGLSMIKRIKNWFKKVLGGLFLGGGKVDNWGKNQITEMAKLGGRLII